LDTGELAPGASFGKQVGMIAANTPRTTTINVATGPTVIAIKLQLFRLLAKSATGVRSLQSL
jgi:hypothetical protein